MVVMSFKLVLSELAQHPVRKLLTHTITVKILNIGTCMSEQTV